MAETYEIVPQKDPPQPTPTASPQVAAGPEQTAAEYRAGFAPSGNQRYDAATADPEEASSNLADNLARLDKSLQAQLLTKLQRQRGNGQVQRLVRQMQRAPGPQSAGHAPSLEDSALADRIAAGSQAGGQPLDAGLAEAVGDTLGAEMGAVRVHTGGEADELSRDLDALAFTTGADIFVSQAAPDLATPAGQHLLAHEAAHTVQQASGPVAGTPQAGGVRVSTPGDSFELAAEEAATAALTPTGEMTAAARRPPAAPLRQAAPNAVQRVTADEGETVPLEEPPVVERTITIDEKGVTTATYGAPGYATSEERMVQTPNTKPEENLVDVSFKVTATFAVTTVVNLPSVPADLTACQKERVQAAITNQLQPHEDLHVAAMKQYDGSFEESVTLTRVAKAKATAEMIKVAKAKADAEAARRKKVAQDASDALDSPPFEVTVNLNCKDEKPPEKKSATAEGGPAGLDGEGDEAEAVQTWRRDQPWPAPPESQ